MCGIPAGRGPGSTLQMAHRQTSDLLRARPQQRAARRPEHLTEQRARPPIVELRRRHQGLPGRPRRPGARQRCGSTAASSSSSSAPPAAARSTLIKTADPRARADRRRGADRRPRHRHALGTKVPRSCAPDRHRLPGLQAAPQPQRLRQRRLRAAGDRRVPRRDPAQGARRAAPGRPRRQGEELSPTSSRAASSSVSPIARAFVNHPPLLLADEPTGNLDPDTSVGIMQLLYRINRTGTTVVVVTHDREMVDKMRRRVIALDERPDRPRPGRRHLHRATSRRASSPCACATRWA